MKTIYAAVLATGLGLLGATPTQAASGLPTPLSGLDTGIELAAGGCGPGRYRDYYGYCRWMAPPPPPAAYYRRCPYGMHMTPWGCRPNY